MKNPKIIAQEILDFCELGYRLNKLEKLFQVAQIMRAWLELMGDETIDDEKLKEFAALLYAHQHISFFHWHWAKTAMNDWITSLGYPPFWAGQRNNDFIWPDELMK